MSSPLPRRAIAAILLFALTTASTAHDVHISYCRSELTPTILSGRVTIYRDDFARALLNWKGAELRRLSGIAMLQAVNAFLAAHLTTSANGAPLPLAVASAGSDNTSIWFDFSFTSRTPIGSLTIGNAILFREYNDQMNLLLVRAPGHEHNFIFTSSKPTATIDL
jgi:hypothetical protein